MYMVILSCSAPPRRCGCPPQRMCMSTLISKSILCCKLSWLCIQTLKQQSAILQRYMLATHNKHHNSLQALLAVYLNVGPTVRNASTLIYKLQHLASSQDIVREFLYRRDLILVFGALFRSCSLTLLRTHAASLAGLRNQDLRPGPRRQGCRPRPSNDVSYIVCVYTYVCIYIYICINIYIYIYMERERHIYIYIYIYV